MIPYAYTEKGFVHANFKVGDLDYRLEFPKSGPALPFVAGGWFEATVFGGRDAVAWVVDREGTLWSDALDEHLPEKTEAVVVREMARRTKTPLALAELDEALGTPPTPTVAGGTPAAPWGTLSMRHLVKYPECNATQNLFGGQMLAWVDEGAAMYAACQMRTDRLVTRKVGEIEFRVPVPLGHVCNVYARTKREGTTSLTVTVTVTRKTFDGTGSEDVVCETDLVFVALGHDGKPTPWKQAA